MQLHRLIVSLLVVITVALTAHGVELPVASTAAPLVAKDNAALTWMRGMLMLPKADHTIWNAGDNISDSSVTDFFRTELELSIELLHRGTEQPGFDWGIRLEQGELHDVAQLLATTRSLVRYAMIHARWHAYHGRTNEALLDLMASLDFCQRTAEQPLSLLGGMIIRSNVHATIIAAARIAPSLTTDQRARLHDRLMQINLSALSSASIRDESHLMLGMMQRARTLGPEQRGRFLSRLLGNSFDAEGLMNADIMFNDVMLDDLLSALPIEYQRWQSLTQRPGLEPYRAPQPIFSTGDTHPNRIINMMGAPLTMAFMPGARAAIIVHQLRAGLAWLDGGDAALSQVQPLAEGMTYLRTATTHGFTITSTIPEGLTFSQKSNRELVLRFGEPDAVVSPSEDPEPAITPIPF